MPIEIRRFGVGHRRPDGPPGTSGVTGQPIHSDGRGAISELAFARGAAIEPHANPNTSWFVVIEGGGWVGVGDERTRVAAGEAVLWPADLPHAAWTEHSEMRAFVVEFTGADDRGAGLLEGRAREVSALGVPVDRGVGQLVSDGTRTRHDPEAGEPA
ncbi:MAG TPA: cupin domain-containing protein [Candidatus Limnocylindrales bacterium]